jgi:hypothetical protein
MKRLFISTLMLLTNTSANAIDIAISEKHNFVYLTGQIMPGDDQEFRSLAKKWPAGSIIYLSSKGGDLMAGFGIAAEIIDRQFQTGVVTDNTCASMCGLIWLAGKTRWLAPSAHVGFHAVRTAATGDISSSGNAWVGGYLRDLGFSYAAVSYFTQAPPESMEWLTPEKAKQLGVNINVMSSDSDRIARWVQQQFAQPRMTLEKFQRLYVKNENKPEPTPARQFMPIVTPTICVAPGRCVCATPGRCG